MLQFKIESDDAREIDAFLKGIGLLVDLQDVTKKFKNRPGELQYRLHCRAHLNTNTYFIVAENEAGDVLFKKRVRLKKPDAPNGDESE